VGLDVLGIALFLFLCGFPRRHKVVVLSFSVPPDLENNRT
jgi:uncharacterized protein (DUF433 family)